MGMMIFLPLILAVLAVAVLSPFIGIACTLGAMLSTVVLVIPGLRMARAKRTHLQVIGAVLMGISAIATIAFVLVAGVSFGVAASFFAGTAA